MLSLHNGSAMGTFRKCLRDEIAARFRVCHGVLPQEAVEYKQWVLRLFVSHGQQLAMRRILLALCPNGDWRSDTVEFYVAPGQQWERDQQLAHVTSGLMAALCARQPTLYKRSRWTGADLATDSLGILEACHKLLSGTYLRFAASFESASRARRLLSTRAPLGGHGAVAGQAMLANEPQVPQPALLDADQGECADAPGPQVPASAVDPRADAPDWAVINARHRKLGAQWVMSEPLGMLIIQRQVMEPLRQLFARIFQVAAEDWELEQRAKVAKKLQTGSAQHTDREYRLAIAAQGTDENRFFEQVGVLFTEALLWKHVPVQCFTFEVRSLTFRLISRSGCLVESLLAGPHRRFPTRLFQLLARPELATEMSSAPKCLFDPWTAEMHRLHPSFSGPVFLERLAMVADLLPKDISHLESRHATLRRALWLASVQTHKMAFADLSAQWCLLQFRRRAQRMAGKRAATSRPALKVPLTKSPTHPPKPQT